MTNPKESNEIVVDRIPFEAVKQYREEAITEEKALQVLQRSDIPPLLDINDLLHNWIVYCDIDGMRRTSIPREKI